MFRPLPGFAAQYQGMTLMVVLDFDQWRVLLQGPEVIIDGGRQVNRAGATELACRIAQRYNSQGSEDVAVPSPLQLEWTPLAQGAFLIWQAQGRANSAAAEA